MRVGRKQIGFDKRWIVQCLQLPYLLFGYPEIAVELAANGSGLRSDLVGIDVCG